MKNIYIHIPFCIKKCYYCDFAVQAIGNKLENQNYYKNYLEIKYIDYLVKEIKNKINIKNNNLETLYFGGGTPSLLSNESLIKIFEELNKFYNLENTEITIECEPNTITKENLKIYKKLGINRISLGLQTYNNILLKNLNRNHSKEDFINSFNLLKYENFNNINVDIMINIPNDNFNNFKETINKVNELNPEHLSLYNFTLEDNSYFGKLYKQGKLKLNNNNLYNKYLQENLKNYNQYEISNYSKIGFESKHNLMYWEGDQDFLSFGLGSVSLENGVRIKKPISLKKYFNYIDNNFNISYCDIEDERKNLNDYLKTIFIGNLRKQTGIKLQKIKKIFLKFENKNFEIFKNQLLLFFKNIDNKYYNINKDSLNLTKIGFLNSNEILSEIFIIIDKI